MLLLRTLDPYKQTLYCLNIQMIKWSTTYSIREKKTRCESILLDLRLVLKHDLLHECIGLLIQQVLYSITAMGDLESGTLW
jgi:hypothetical protein